MAVAFLSPSAFPARASPARRPRTHPFSPEPRWGTCTPRAILRIPIFPPKPGGGDKRQRRPAPPPVLAETPAEAKRAVERALGGRLDCLITGFGNDGRIAAALGSHARRFNALVLVPTRLLAEAAAVEIEPSSGESRVILVVGRSPKALADPARTAMYLNNAEKGAVVVATPRGICNAFFRTGNGPKWLRLIERLVLSDPHHMAEIGCLPQITRILKFTPETARRHTVVLARTDPAAGSRQGADGAVHRLVKSMLRPRTQIVAWPGEAMDATQRAARIPQRYCVLRPEQMLPALGAAIADARRTDRHKIVIFLPTAKMVQFYAALFRGLDVPVEELHGRRSPHSQTRALQLFSDRDDMVLFSSEMSAARAAAQRVTHVMQIGAPKDPEQYARRVAVANPGEGSALLLLCDFERDVALQAIGESAATLLEASCYAETEAGGKDGFVQEAHEVVKNIPWQLAAGAYMSWLAEYTTKRKALGWTKEELVRRGAEWAKLTTGAGPWSVPPRFADRLSLWRVPGIVVAEGVEHHLAFNNEAGMIGWDRSLEQVEEVKSGKVGPRGRNVLPRRLKEKKPKIEDWRKVLKKISVKDLQTLKTLNRRSPEGKKFMAGIVKKALDAGGPDKVKKKKKKPNPPKKKQAKGPDAKKRKKERLRIESWAPANIKGIHRLDEV